MGVWGEGTVLIIVCSHHAHISPNSPFLFCSWAVRSFFCLFCLLGKKTNAEQNWFSSLAFHLTVGTHALRSLWVLIHRGRYFALKPFATMYTRSDFAIRTTISETSFYCYQLCVCVCVRKWEAVTVLLWSDWKDFFPFALCAAWFLGSGGCSNLHCFACWLMLCLWERCAWCEVNSCALQYHCIPLFSVSSLSVCYSFTGKGKARTKQLCRMWCHYLHSENVPIGKVW